MLLLIPGIFKRQWKSETNLFLIKQFVSTGLNLMVISKFKNEALARLCTSSRLVTIIHNAKVVTEALH